MPNPKMILFDYGQTLIAEEKFDGVKGTAAVMSYASANKRGLTPEQVQEEAECINTELRRFDTGFRTQYTAEIPNYMFTAYLYESLGITIDLSEEDIDRVFWDAASPGKPTEGIEKLLARLWEKGIRTAVLSNITYAGSVVSERINRLLPDNHFEFIIATSDYLFRKPNTRIFRLAAEKAGLSADEMWYIGDNYLCDIVGARNAGFFPVWYRGASDTAKPGYDDVTVITEWPELDQMLE